MVHEFRGRQYACRAAGVCAVLLSAGAFVSTPAAAAFEELGDAANYSLLGLGKPSEDALGGAGSVDLASSTVFGDVGIGAYGTLDFEGPALIDGDLYLDPLIKHVNTSSGDVTGNTIYQDLSAAVADALDAASYYAALAQ